MNKEKDKLPYRKKHILFWGLLIALPVLFLITLELLLRLFGYGSSYPLVHKERRFNKEKYVVNREVARRYFSLPSSYTPEAPEEIFDYKKRSNGVRIVCIGGSSTAGFPYEINATFPFQLQFRLRNSLLNNYVEVINLGISAVNSFTVLDLMPEILELEPDVIILYMGHNEFYGAYGVGSTQYIGNNRDVILTYLKLRRFRVVQLLKNVVLEFKKRSTETFEQENTSLMKQLAADQTILMNSEKYNIAAKNFQDNLTAIIRMAKKQEVVVLTSNLVSNLKDQKPFISALPDSRDPAEQRKYNKLRSRVLNYQNSASHLKALQTLDTLRRLDSLSAEVYYYCGRSLLARGDTSGAFQAFSRARDLDLLRFRAPDTLNRIIRKVSIAQNVPMVDMQSVFRAASPSGIPGNGLFHEHLHPTFDGYRLMAQAFFKALRKIQFINPPDEIGWEKKLLSARDIQRILKQYKKNDGGVTPLDLEFGHVRMYLLTRRWPFSKKLDGANFYMPLGSEPMANIAIHHVKKEISWDAAHYELATHYIRKKQFEKAYREYRAVNLSFYENYYPHVKIGDLFLLQEQFKTARNWYLRALKYAPGNSNVLAKLGEASTLAGKFQEAVHYLNQALEKDTTDSNLNNTQKTMIYYLLGLSFANMRNWRQANLNLGKALHLQPEFQPALKLRSDIKTYRTKPGM